MQGLPPITSGSAVIRFSSVKGTFSAVILPPRLKRPALLAARRLLGVLNPQWEQGSDIADAFPDQKGIYRV